LETGLSIRLLELITRRLANGAFTHSDDIHLVRPSVRYTPLKTRIFVDCLIEQFSVPPWDNYSLY